MFYFNVNMARRCGVNASLVYSALLEISEQISQEEKAERNGLQLFPVLNDTLEFHTALSRYQIKQALEILETKGLVKTAIIGGPPKKYFCLMEQEETGL